MLHLILAKRPRHKDAIMIMMAIIQNTRNKCWRGMLIKGNFDRPLVGGDKLEKVHAYNFE